MLILFLARPVLVFVRVSIPIFILLMFLLDTRFYRDGLGPIIGEQRRVLDERVLEPDGVCGLVHRDVVFD